MYYPRPTLRICTDEGGGFSSSSSVPSQIRNVRRYRPLDRLFTPPYEEDFSVSKGASAGRGLGGFDAFYPTPRRLSESAYI